MLLCLPVSDVYVKDIAFTFTHFIWQSHLASTLLAAEKSPEHESGYLQDISLIAYSKSELNEFQPHSEFIEMRQ